MESVDPEFPDSPNDSGGVDDTLRPMEALDPDDVRNDDGDEFPDVVFQQMPDPDFLFVGRFDQFCYCGLVGTSMASPHVAGVAALLFSQGIGDARSVRAALEQTADDLGASGRDDQFGHGLVNPAKALSGVGLNQ